MPVFSLTMSASATWAQTVMVSRLAICTITGADCDAFTVWPSSEVCDTTVPLIGAWILV